ncbi:hypothetical protein [Pseudactinotalea sp. HY158]|uniref:hypothetical protein n=1 Tax=Pseudactinotalea sp. HY158 TaxID=2654547 RepID=UPI00129D045A|nr:hypothetical protein [Pseudactinotalea sp. HY158]QGH70076.1 hypothetical protein GCE65_11585 [Pseudactinotalea sp. HY158]
MERASTRLKRIAKRLSRTALKAARTVVSTAPHADADGVSLADGRTLNIRLYVPPGEHARALRFRNGASRRRIPLLMNSDAESATITVMLDANGADLRIGRWTMSVETERHRLPLMISGPARKHATATVIRPHPPARSDHLVRHIGTNALGLAVITVSSPTPSIDVTSVDASLYRIRLTLTPVETTVERMWTHRRTSHTRLEIPFHRISGAVIVDLPLTAMANQAYADDEANPTWEVVVETPAGHMKLQNGLSDIRNPRNAVRYKSIRLAGQPGRPIFRPYWTLDARLAIEQRSSTKPTPTTTAGSPV